MDDFGLSSILNQTEDLTLLKAIEDVKNKLTDITISHIKDSVEVSNFDELNKAIHNELGRALVPILLPVIQAIKDIHIPETVIPPFPEIPTSFEVNNFPAPQDLSNYVTDLKNEIRGLADKFNVTIESKESSSNFSLDFHPLLMAISNLGSKLEPIGLLSRDPNKPISVRLSNGRKFIQALKEVSDSQERLAYSFSNSSGLTKEEMTQAINAASLTTTSQSSSSTSVTSVANSASSVTLLSLNTNRKMATFFNDASSASVYLKCGTTASSTSYTIKIAAGGYFELPLPIYTGRIDALATAASGNMRITEYT